MTGEEKKAKDLAKDVNGSIELETWSGQIPIPLRSRCLDLFTFLLLSASSIQEVRQSVSTVSVSVTMVDAFSRFFGKGSKKPNQPPSPSDPASSAEDDGFTLVGGQPKPADEAAAWFAGGGRHGQPPQYPIHPAYPALPPSDSASVPPAYGLRPGAPPTGGGTNPGGGGTAAGYSSGTLQSQTSLTGASVLDAIPFELSDRFGPPGSGRGVDQVMDSVDTTLERVQDLLANAASYDFRLEKNVVGSDVSASMERMRTS